MPRAATVRLAGFYAAYFGTVGVWMPFWPAWLESRDLGPGWIGLILGVGFWIRVVSNPLVGWLADVRGERRRPMILLAALATVTFVAFAAAEVPWHFLLLSAIAGTTFTVLVPFADSVTLARVRSDGIDYGRVRLWGSVAFIATSVGAGQLLEITGTGLTLWLVVGLVSATFVSCVLMPEDRDRRSDTGASLADVRHLLIRPRFLLLVLAGGLVQGSHAVYYGFGTIHWRAAGMSSLAIGLLWAEGVIAEILLFVVGRRLTEGRRPATLLAVGGAAGVLRWTVLSATTHPAALVAVQGLHALTFAATHLGAMSAMGRWVPEGLSATALTVYSTFVGGIALGVAMALSGTLYEVHGGAAFLFATALSATGLVTALVLRRVASSAEPERVASG